MNKKSHKSFRIDKSKARIPAIGKLSIGVDNYRPPADYENKYFNIGHGYYKEKLCELKHMKASPLKSVLDKYKKVSKYNDVAELRKQLGFTRILNSNHYKQFYSGLEDDVVLEEFRLADGCRTFFFINPSLKVLEVVAITHHPEDTKQM